MNELERMAQQIAHNTFPHVHAQNCARKFSAPGQLITTKTTYCNCHVVSSAKNKLVRDYPGEWDTNV